MRILFLPCIIINIVELGQFQVFSLVNHPQKEQNDQKSEALVFDGDCRYDIICSRDMSNNMVSLSTLSIIP